MPAHAVSVVISDDLTVSQMKTILTTPMNTLISVQTMGDKPMEQVIHFKVEAEVESLEMLEYLLTAVLHSLKEGDEIVNEMTAMADVDRKTTEAFDKAFAASQTKGDL